MNDPLILHSLGPTARQLGLPPWRLAYLIERGDVPGPSITVPGRRLFTEGDIARLRTAIESLATGRPRRRRGRSAQ